MYVCKIYMFCKLMFYTYVYRYIDTCMYRYICVYEWRKRSPTGRSFIVQVHRWQSTHLRSFTKVPLKRAASAASGDSGERLAERHLGWRRCCHAQWGGWRATDLWAKSHKNTRGTLQQTLIYIMKLMKLCVMKLFWNTTISLHDIVPLWNIHILIYHQIPWNSIAILVDTAKHAD